MSWTGKPEYELFLPEGHLNFQKKIMLHEHYVI